MDRIWDPFSRRTWRKFWESFPEFEAFLPRAGVRAPLIDVLDEGKTIRVIAELPGLEKKDISVNVLEDSVEISTEKKAEVKEEKEREGYYFHERSYQKFYRKIPLPAAVIPEKTKAEYKNGILELILQKKVTTKVEKGFKPELK